MGEEAMIVSTTTAANGRIDDDDDDDDERNINIEVDIYPLSRYYFGSKHPIPFKDHSLSNRLQRIKSNYAARGMRTCVEAVIMVELFKHPHLLLLQVRNSIFKLPGGRLRPGESDADGLKRKLARKLSADENGNGAEWEVGECLGMWWKPDFETLMYPFLPPNVKQPKECTKLFLVRLPESRRFTVPKNMKLLSVPLCQIHENHKNMVKKGSIVPNLKLTVPASDQASSFSAKFLTQSGTFKEGNLLVNRDGVRIVSQSEVEARPPIRPLDNQLSLADIDRIKVIGKGNGGIVQLVQHKWTNQFFALKQIQMNNGSGEYMHRHIAQELRINLSAQCPYIVMCYQSIYDNGIISIILEYMDGGSLEDLLNKVKTIPEEYLAAICKQVLKGLTFLHHEKHIIHRDLKPSNLLINHRGEVKITDFGVSAIMESTSGQANTYIGTRNYMSPERIIGGEKGYNYKSDMWSLGLMLLNCVTGKFPYAPPDQSAGWENIFQLIEAVVEKPPPTAPSDQCSPEFCSFISACLEKNPRERPSAPDLLKHPFVNMYDDLDVDLSAYFSNAGSTLATI